MNRQDILPLLWSAKNVETYQQIRSTLSQENEVELFHSLFWISIEPQYQTPPIPVACAGNLLFDLNPACQISCMEAIRSMLPGWDVSFEEVPWYLYKQFGIEALQKAMNQLRSEPLPKEHRVRLDTIKYWANVIHTEGIEANEKRRP